MPGKSLRNHASWGYAHGQGGIYAADRMRSRRENEKTATGKCLHFSYGGSRFMMPVETDFPFPRLHAEKISFTNTTNFAYWSPEDFILWTPVCDVCRICKNRFFRMRLGERNNCFHRHHKTKATAGNCASTFRQQPFVFPSAPQPIGG